MPIPPATAFTFISIPSPKCTPLVAGVSDGQLSDSVSEFDAIMSGPFQNFLNLSKKIGGDVAAQGDMASAAFQAQRNYILLASKAKQPAAADVPALLKPTSDKISEIQSFREKQRRSQFFNHLSAVSESIPALGWVTMAPTPGPFVKEMNDAGQFYTNRVLKEWKDKDKTHVEWTKAWVGTLTEMQAYVKKNHTTGLVWNPKGGDAKTISGSTGEWSGVRDPSTIHRFWPIKRSRRSTSHFLKKMEPGLAAGSVLTQNLLYRSRVGKEKAYKRDKSHTVTDSWPETFPIPISNVWPP